MRYITFCLLLILCVAFTPEARHYQNSAGAWKANQNGITHVLLVADNYLSLSAFDAAGRKFYYTMGGPVQLRNNQWQVTCEYHSKDSTKVGTLIVLPMRIDGDALISGKVSLYDGTELPLNWNRIDNANTGLAGNWRITQRMQEGQLQPIHQSGTRKTVKLLTGTRFQWVAIDPGVKGFYGTGGGTYTFKDGKYTEHIEFFSRDSSRVGASLSFTGKLEKGDWHHSGKSSRGDDIYEVWSRKEIK